MHNNSRFFNTSSNTQLSQPQPSYNANLSLINTANSFSQKRIRLKVKDIHFTQNSVSSSFNDGRLLSEVVTQLINRQIFPNSIPSIRVVKQQGKWLTLDNRRLRVFKDAFINEIEVFECDLKNPDIKQEFNSKKTNKSATEGGLIRTQQAFSKPSKQHFEDGVYVFTKTVLNWTFGQIEQPLERLRSMQPLPDNFTLRDFYYLSFLGLILEEARAILQTGIETVNLAKTPPLELSLANLKPAKNRQNPGKISFYKKLQKNEVLIKANDAVLLEYKANTDIKLLALATYAKDEEFSNKLTFKTIIDEFTQLLNYQAFQESAEWQVKVIGSLVTTMRMYEACTTKPQLSWEKELLASPNSPFDFYNYSSFSYLSKPISLDEAHNLEKLNPSQQAAVTKFLESSDSLQLIQGPPGTGKTTTIIALLKILSQRGTRTLVCAPSNKAVQIIAERFITENPNIPVAFAGIEDKLPEDKPPLQKTFIHTWGKLHLEQLNMISNSLWDLLPNTQSSAFMSQWQNTIYNKLSTLQTQFIEVTEDFERYQLKLIPDMCLARTNFFVAIELYSKLASALDNKLISLSDFLAKARNLLNQLTSTLTTLQLNLEKISVDDSAQGLEGQLLNNSTIIFATLSVSGRKAFKEMNIIDTLIVDEAGQAVEAETIIPFMTKPKRCLLIGDIKQLPATVISKPAEQLGFERSLMERLISGCHYEYSMLNEQYRMHPEISQWPSKQYYGNELTNALSVQGSHRIISTLKNAPSYFSPYAFININSTEKDGGLSGYSYSNEEEIKFIGQLVAHLQQQYNIDAAEQIGVITFYKGQADALKTALQKKFKGMRVNTVDGFQGGEADIIIISFVRANQKGTLGFLNDYRRLNVALTRARFSLIMVGNAATLEQQKRDISTLIMDARLRKQFFEGEFIQQTFISSKPFSKNTKTCSFFDGKPNSCRKREKCEFKHDLPLSSLTAAPTFKTTLSSNTKQKVQNQSSMNKQQLNKEGESLALRNKKRSKNSKTASVTPEFKFVPVKITSPASHLKVNISPDKYSSKLLEKQPKPQLPKISTFKQAIGIDNFLSTTSASINNTTSKIASQTTASLQPRKPKSGPVKAVIDLYMEEQAEELSSSTNRKRVWDI